MAGVEPNPGPTSSGSLIRFGFLNIRSATHKAATLHDVITDSRLDIVALSETWFYADTPDTIKDAVAPPGFRAQHTYRQPSASGSSRGGGLSIIHREEFSSISLDTSHLETTSFEVQATTIRLRPYNMTIVNVYRPPSAPTDVFLTEFGDLVSFFITRPNDRILFCGDFNPTGFTEELNFLFAEFGLTQHVTCPTRNDRILDLLLSANSTDTVHNVATSDAGCISDHRLVTCDIRLVRPPPRKVTYSYRDLRKMDLASFRDQLLQSSLFASPATTTEAFTQQLTSVVSQILEDTAPLQTRTKVRSRVINVRLSEEALRAKRERRRLERKWHSNGSEDTRTCYRRACRRANKLINTSRREHQQRLISEFPVGSHQRWKATDRLLHPAPPPYRRPEDEVLLCNRFAAFFVSKVSKLCNLARTAAASLGNRPNFADAVFSGPTLSALPAVVVDDVSKLIASLPLKSSPMDFLPTSLLKSCSDIFAPLLTHLANLSFTEGIFPSSFKIAHISPLLKKPGLDTDDPSNYRPISNLNTISKILEKLFLRRIIDHVHSSPSFSAFQSAYRHFHSTETALIKITNDILASSDAKSPSVLISLDISAAFDTIDHPTLLDRLRQAFGFEGAALHWLESYISGRSSFVRIGSASSSSLVFDVGVPQGSVLGPLLFSLYISPLGHLIDSLGISYHQYADDTQLYLALSATTGLHQGLATLSACSSRVQDWLACNGLVLNSSKSEAIRFGTPEQLKRLSTAADSIKIAGVTVGFTSCLKSLGVTLDSRLSFEHQIRAVCQSGYYHIRALRHIRNTLSDDDARSVASALVASRLDYCNSLYYGAHAKSIAKLQRLQNTLARVVTRTRRFDHITPVLRSLHWLPVPQRITFKLALTIFKTRFSGQPSYLSSLLVPYLPTRSLRSSTMENLLVPRSRTKFGSKAFRVAGPTIWNSLPLHLKTADSLPTFKKYLKAHLFNTAYDR